MNREGNTTDGETSGITIHVVGGTRLDIGLVKGKDGWYTSTVAGPFDSQATAEAFWVSIGASSVSVAEPPTLGIHVSDEAVPRDKVGG
jgi:hypothetical protein